MAKDEITHWRELIKVYAKRLKVLELQKARYGSEYPPHLEMEVEEIKDHITSLEGKIESCTEREHQVATNENKIRPSINTKEQGIFGFSGRVICPYPGMVPFRLEDARFFYGRETEIQHALQHLRYHRYLFVVGPSGSGKSSLIFAGLLPRLKESSYFSESFWLIRSMRPGDQPMHALADAVGGDLDQLSQTLTDVLTTHTPAQRLLLVIDQFEELFTQSERSEQNRFISVIKTLQQAPSCTLLIVMRADFYPDLMTSDLWPVAPRKRLEIAPLRGETLRLAIQQPAADVGVRLEPGLLERLMIDAADEPGTLPLVQETMVLLWEKMVDHVIPLSAYDQLGSEDRSGLAAAMVMKADATLDELSTKQQLIARRIFLRLVQFGEGRADTRRQQPITNLRSAGDDLRLFEETLRHLADNRLLTLDGKEGGIDRKVDLAHEALIRGWPTLRQWLIDWREAEQTRRRLDAKVAEWIRLGRGLGGLLDEVELGEADEWLKGPDVADLGYDELLVELVGTSWAAIMRRGQLAKVAEQEDLAQLRNFIQRYVSTRLADEFLATGGDLDAPTEHLVVVLFADLRGYISLTEGLSPNVVVNQILNPYFKLMIEVLHRHGGMVDKLLGDGIIGVFGIPIGRMDDIERSLVAAVDMQISLAELRNTWRAELGLNMGMGIGVGYGPAIVGTIGLAQRLEYTLIGDVVNTSSRLNGLAQPGQIIISYHVIDALPSDWHLPWKLRPIGRILLKGKQEPHLIYEVEYLSGDSNISN